MIRIKELREEKGISQKELGKLLNVAQNTISNWGNGSREPDSKVPVKLAEILDCSTDYLQNRIDKAINYLENVYANIKKNPYYRYDHFLEKRVLHHNYVSDPRILPIHIKELKEKIERGYVYRPRRKKTSKECAAG